MSTEETFTHSKYLVLRDVLERAYRHAAVGKGRERHSVGEPFDEQPIVVLGKWMGGTTGFNVGQACKKSIESMRLPRERAVDELLGAINYLAGAVVILESQKPYVVTPEAQIPLRQPPTHDGNTDKIKLPSAELTERIRHPAPIPSAEVERQRNEAGKIMSDGARDAHAQKLREMSGLAQENAHRALKMGCVNVADASLQQSQALDGQLARLEQYKADLHPATRGGEKT
jgi:hypothetical protein